MWGKCWQVCRVGLRKVWRLTKFIGDVMGEALVYHTKEPIIIESLCNWEARVRVYVGGKEWGSVPNKFWGI